MEWINSNTGILVLISIAFATMKFLLLRWQGYEQNKDLRDHLLSLSLAERHIDLLFKLHERGVVSDEEFMSTAKRLSRTNLLFAEGSKHQWIKEWFKKKSSDSEPSWPWIDP